MMIEKLVPFSLVLICIGGFGSVVEYILFRTMNIIIVGYIGLMIAIICFMIAIHYWDKDENLTVR